MFDFRIYFISNEDLLLYIFGLCLNIFRSQVLECQKAALYESMPTNKKKPA